jgi:phosphonoacetate hydrolase
MSRDASVTVNGRSYRLRSRPIVAVCLDGGAREYLRAAAHLMPRLGRILALGSEGQVRTVVPSFTNPNNMSIVTGVAPDVHGICGNTYYDAARQMELPMNDPACLRAPTVLAAFGRAGQTVAAITVKDKLRRLLGKDLGGVSFSVEKAETATLAENGIEDLRALVGRAKPDVYDPEASAWAFEAGIRLLDTRRLHQLYLSTTDYVQHKHPPGSPEADRFYARLDPLIGELDRRGVILGITADHGMNPKVRADGSPNVRFLESLLAARGIRARVVLPITDPYIAHHGALGSFATVYLKTADVLRAAQVLRAIEGVEAVLGREEAARRFELPADRIGDLVVLADRTTVLGRTAEWHDLTAVKTGLRSHGGLHEATVPMIFNRPLRPAYAERLHSGEARSRDLYDFLANGTED